MAQWVKGLSQAKVMILGSWPGFSAQRGLCFFLCPSSAEFSLSLKEIKYFKKENSMFIHTKKKSILDTHKDLANCLWIQPLVQSAQQESNNITQCNKVSWTSSPTIIPNNKNNCPHIWRERHCSTSGHSCLEVTSQRLPRNDSCFLQFGIMGSVWQLLCRKQPRPLPGTVIPG